MNLPDYDQGFLRSIFESEDRHQIGTEEGQECGRVAEPDEDAPRGYRPKPCKGVMVRTVSFNDRHVTCDTCGEIAS